MHSVSVFVFCDLILTLRNVSKGFDASKSGVDRKARQWRSRQSLTLKGFGARACPRCKQGSAISGSVRSLPHSTQLTQLRASISSAAMPGWCRRLNWIAIIFVKATASRDKLACRRHRYVAFITFDSRFQLYEINLLSPNQALWVTDVVFSFADLHYLWKQSIPNEFAEQESNKSLQIRIDLE